MKYETLTNLDDVDRRILSELQRDGRITMRALGEIVGLSAPAVADRVRRLEDRGVIRGYRADLNPAALGLGVVAFLTLGAPYDERGNDRFENQVHGIEEAVECYRVSGEDRYLVKVFASDVPALQEVIDRLRGFSRVRSAIVLSVLKQGGELRPAPPSTRAVFHYGAD
jgi:Lrp/AsnC family leucine-responsive transcriptional regulator